MEFVISQEDERYTKKYKIYDYILNHKETTEYRVAKYARKERICARATTHNIIDDLIDEDKVIDMKDGNGFHKLSINDKSDYQRLISRIDNLSKGIAEVNGIIDDPSFKKVILPGLKAYTAEDKILAGSIIEYSEIRHICQVSVYQTIDTIFRDIMKLTSDSDRQTLYTRLIHELYKAKGFRLLFDVGVKDKLWEKLCKLGYQNKEREIIFHLLDVLNKMG